ncbi:MAG: ATP-binding cassette domain-containing protein [Synergistaceae bacterium]|nr:ATP-binding cassette domain-containing protein [Synergistaceae bacterium]
MTGKGLLHAVDNVDLQIPRGTTLGVVGESGCGKSTLGRVLLHLLDSTSGRIIFEGKDITNVPKKELKELRKDMQMIFQDPYASLNPRMTVMKIIEEPLRIYKVYNSKEEYRKRVEELMDVVGLTQKVAKSYPHELDGGRRQRVGVGRALALQPKFIVCDEPVSALDVSIQAQILNLMQNLQKEFSLTYIFITHDLSVVKHISNEICVMYLGVVVEKCSTKELFRTQYHPYTQALLTAIPRPSLKKNVDRIVLKGELTSPINLGPGCRFASRCMHAEDICEERQPKYEEITEGHFASCHFARNFK